MTAAVTGELSRTTPTTACCRRAEAITVLRFAGGLHQQDGQVHIEVDLATLTVARRVGTTIRDLCGHRGPARDPTGHALRSGAGMRAVLDPNVLVSAVLSRGGTPAALPRAWLEGGFELIVSSALLGVLERVLGYPKIAKRISPEEARELLDVLRLQADLFEDPDSAPLVRSPDPHDDYLICLGEAATAVIVSGDSDLLGLADQIPVYTPTAFLALLAQT